MKRNETKNALAGKNAAELQTELEALLKEQFGLRMQRRRSSSPTRRS